MAFKVWLDNRDAPQECSDGDVYDFLNGGVLEVFYTAADRCADFHHPARWKHLEAQSNHRPAEPADRSVKPECGQQTL